MKCARSCLILFFLVWLPGTAAADWSNLRGDAQGQAAVEYRGTDTINAWQYLYKNNQRYQPGVAIWASPALDTIQEHPVAFIGGFNQALLALDLGQQQVRWLKLTNGPITSAPAIGRVDKMPVVFFGSSDRTVYALRAEDGGTCWTHMLVEAAPTLSEADVSSPALHGGKLYITCFVYDRSLANNQQSCRLYCLDQRQGNLLWQKEIGRGFVSSPTGFLLDNRFHLVIAARKGLLQCWDCSGGLPVLRWTYQMPHEVLGSPVVEENRPDPLIFLGSKFGNLIALEARTGRVKWKRMAGNWIDNTAAIGQVDGKNVVFTGSYDYRVYAFETASGKSLWNRSLNGEVYSAPCFFSINSEPLLAVSALDNHLYVLRARSGEIHSVYHTGKPLWDKVPKGETLWGSPAVFQAGRETTIIHGSYNGYIFAIPVLKSSELAAKPHSAWTLWFSLAGVAVIFLAIILPLLLYSPRGMKKKL